MIEATFKGCEDIYSYEVSGHANYESHGRDIVCAAVSALVISVSNELEEVAKIENELGLIKVEIERPDVRTRILTRTLLNGLLEISEEYPSYVSVCLEN